MRLLWLAGLATVVAAAPAHGQTSVPPARYESPGVARAQEPPARLLLPPGSAAREVSLRRPDAAEVAARRSMREGASAPVGKPYKRRALMAGFARPLPAAEARMPLAELPWRSTDDGTRAARLTVTSPGAVALRAGLAVDAVPPGLVLRFQGSGGAVLGPVAAGEIAAAADADGLYWSPVLEGETATIEFALPPGGDAIAGAVVMAEISHLFATAAGGKAVGIGSAGACEVDIACLDPALQLQLRTATNAVARMLVTIDGDTFLCSGTVLNDSTNSFTPYFLTANHCIDDLWDPVRSRGIPAAAAATINTYWSYQAASCGSVASPAYTLLPGGAKLVARSLDYDWALLRLNVQPPHGTTYAGWNADGPLASGQAVHGIHHPGGGLKKASAGATQGYQAYSDGSTFIAVRWSSGVTEGGSSGSGLFTANPLTGHHELRGALTGGESACAFPQGIDEYSRFDTAYPLIKPALAPSAQPATLPVVEFYNALADQYLITADPFEIAGRDSGVPAGWVRTGYRFLAYATAALAPAGAQPVCRLYAPPPHGDVRFYSASAEECAQMLAREGEHWLLENAAAFHLPVPGALTAACPAGTQAIYRFADASAPKRRRYTAEVGLRDALRADAGWIAEGGKPPDHIAMCAPLVDPDMKSASAALNYQGLWWRAPAGSESGWGINFAHQDDTIFATWFTYRDDGRPRWFAAELARTGAETFSGSVFTTTGPPFGGPFDPAQVVETVVGSMTVTFGDASTGTFAWTVDGVAQTKAITRQVFASPVPTCRWGGAQHLAPATNYQDLWWASPPGSEAGWGINFTHQGDAIFATWFTYDAAGEPRWLIALVDRTAGSVYSGPVWSVTGPAYTSSPFDPARVRETVVGAMTLAFADGNNATMSYTVDGITGAKQITRQVFAARGTVCQ
jgi:hypothetical protein